METTVLLAKRYPRVAVQMFKMQLDQARIVEISHEVMTGVRIAAHLDDSISHLRRQLPDMFRIPGIVMPNPAAARERGLIGKAKKQN
ncbi:hypothetical protein ES703_106233 [subsurface metagenome]